jgi:hypothetical protein
MSEYFDNKELFLQPKTKQYGSHMVMTNVHKETKTKYVNIDTRFRDDYTYSQIANYTITLPERITEVKSIYITNAEVPDVLYNISSVQNNNSFLLTKSGTNAKYVITVPDNKYAKISELHTILNTQLRTVTGDNNITVSLNSSNKSAITSTTNTYAVNFAVDSSGNTDKSLLNSKLGWILGFRNISYTINSTGINAEALPDIFGPKYLYLAIDEFSHGNQRSFISPLPKSIINKNIAARISVSTTRYGFNNLITANRADGSMVSDKREYTGKVDLQRLHVQLLDEYGNPVSLNGLDFSFCMEVEHE